MYIWRVPLDGHVCRAALGDDVKSGTNFSLLGVGASFSSFSTSRIDVSVRWSGPGIVMLGYGHVLCDGQTR